MRTLLLGILCSWLVTSVRVSSADADPPSDVLVATGFEQLRDNDADAAEKSFRAALKQDHQAAGAYFGRAMVAAAAENIPRAVAYFEREIKNTPAVGESYNNAGVMQARRNNLVAAIVHFAAGADRLGANETLFNNFGRCLDEYFYGHDPSEALPKEVTQAAAMFERLEQQISLNPPQPGLVRWGSKWITVQEREIFEETNRRIDSEVAQKQREIEQILIELREKQGERAVHARRLDVLRHDWDLYPDHRTEFTRDEILELEARITRLDARIAGLQDAATVAGNAILELRSRKVRPSWFTQYVLLDWPGVPATAPSARKSVPTDAP